MDYYDFNQSNSLSLDSNSDSEISQTQYFVLPQNHKDSTSEDLEDFLTKKENQKTISGEKTNEKTISQIYFEGKFDEDNKENNSIDTKELGTKGEKNEIIEDNNHIKKVKAAIFKISRVPKKNTKKGRIPYKYNNIVVGDHSRKAEDNIIRKIKRSFIEKVRKFINKKYQKCSNSNIQLIKRISSKETLKIKREDNLAFFDMTLKELFSSKISEKYKLYSSNDNINQINKLYKEKKAIDVIKILDMTVREIYQIYIDNNKRKGFEELNNLKYDLLIRKKEMLLVGEDAKDINDYLILYKKIAIELEQIFWDKKARKSSKK